MVKKMVAACLVLLCSACASNYRLVKTEQMDALNQCAIASEHNHQVLLEQQQTLAQGLDEMLLQLENARQLQETLSFQGCPEPEAVTPTPPAAAPVVKEAISTDIQRVGATEQVRFDSLGLVLEARIDTGIATAVLGVSELVEFERNGENWVRFQLQSGEGEEPREVELRSPRRQTMQLRNGQTSSRRPVVSLPITLGQVSQMAEFILTERKKSEFAVLLGRMVLRDVMLVDVSRNHLAPLPPPPKTDPLEEETAP